MKFENDAERIAMIVSINSIIGNLLLSLGKLIAGFVAQSAAMVSDGIHSASDVFGTLIVMAGVKFSNKASDEEHPYGHERIECIAAILLAIILTIIALLIGEAAGQNWWCVVYPPLCMTAAADVQETGIACGMEQEELKLMQEAGEEYQIRFRCVELWEQLRQWLHK